MNDTVIQTDTDWLLVSIDGEDAEFAMAKPGPEPALTHNRRYKTRDYATAIDMFQHYAQDADIVLNGLTCGLVVSGAVLADSVRIARCPWILSRSGLGYVLGRPPVTVNDSAVKSWANIGHSPRTHRSLSSAQTPDFNKPGRWATVMMNGGLGASALIRSQGGRPVLVDTEIGHVGFAPHNKQEQALAEILQGYRGGTSWEMALHAHEDTALWSRASLSTDPRDIAAMRAAMLGSFAGDVVLAMGSWDGLFLHCAPRTLENETLVQAFNSRFEEKTAYKTQVRATPRWIVTMPEANLQGAAFMLWQQTGENAHNGGEMAHG